MFLGNRYTNVQLSIHSMSSVQALLLCVKLMYLERSRDLNSKYFLKEFWVTLHIFQRKSPKQKKKSSCF